MRALKEAYTGLMHLILDDPLTRATNALQEAVREQSRRLAECHYQQHLVHFFDDEAAAVDPHTDWRHFANLKDKWLEHKTDLEVESNRLAEAEGKVAACRARLQALKLES